MAPVATFDMSSDVHLGGRGPKTSPRKAHDAGGWDGYYGEEDGHQEWWEGQEYAGYDGGMAAGYYDEYADVSGEWDHFEVDLYSMVFNLDEHLEPQEMKDVYKGFEIDQKSLFFVLQEEDIDEQSPQAWKSRPLKIHPEPAPRLERKDSMSLSPASNTVQPSAVLGTPEAGSPILSSPRMGPQLSHSPQREGVTPRSDALVASADSPSATSDAPGSQSPKMMITISNVQLENLKKKMEFLKQKRSGGAGMMPMELPPAANGSKEASEEARRKNKELPCTSNCPGTHGLKPFKTPDDGWWCSVCEREHSKDSAFFGCRICDYDECETCARAPVKKLKPSTPAQAKSSKESKESSADAENSSQGEEKSPSPKRSSPQSSKKSSKDKEKRKDASPPSRATTPPRRHKKRHKDDKHEEGRRKKHTETRRASSREETDKGRKASLSAADSRGAQSDEASSSEEERRSSATGPQRRVTRENKLVPRGKRSRPDASEESASPDRSKNTGKALAAAVRNAAAGRRPTLRRAAPERKPSSRASQSRERGSSEEPPAKKRASVTKTSGNSLASRVEEDARGTAASSASVNLRAGGSSSSGLRGSPEAPRSAVTGPAVRGGGYGTDLLRRILQGNARGNAGREGKPPTLGRGIGGPAASALKEIAPTPEEKSGAMLKPSAPRERDTTRAPNAIGRGFGKALQQIASQEEGRGTRRGR